MKRALLLFLAISAFSFNVVMAQKHEEIRVIFRGDDIGMAHGINEAIIEAYQDGILRTAEVMTTGAWFPEAVKLLNENPGLEVGVHLVLTSGWDQMKSRPLTHAPSLVDENGYFYPIPKPNGNYPDSMALINNKWKAEEVEKELRAQIEMALENIDNVTHLSPHMGPMSSSPELRTIFEKVGTEYGLPYEFSLDMERIRVEKVREKRKSPEEKEAELVSILEKLGPGNWMLVSHPGLDTPEIQALSHPGYETVAYSTAGDTFMLTSKKVQELIERRGIRIITYQDLIDNDR
ncbi:MAG: ChbG/HpnK family deacetylase [Bacteroidota bacterium]